MQKPDRRMKARLENTAWICAMLIVYMHVAGWGRALTSSGACVQLILADTIVPGCVAYFCWLAGWCLGGEAVPMVTETRESCPKPADAGLALRDAPFSEISCARSWYVSVLRSRFHSLFVPFLLLATIDFIGSNGWRVISDLRHGRSWCASFTLPGVLADFGLHPYDFPGHNILWLLRVVMILVVISPVLLFLTGRTGRRGAFVVAAIAAAVVSAVHPLAVGARTPLNMFFYTTFWLPGLALFALGLWMRIAEIPLSAGRSSRIALWVLAVFCMALRIVAPFVGVGPGWNQLYYLTGFPIVLAVLYSMPSVPIPCAWTWYAVFALHTCFTCVFNVLNLVPAQLGAVDYLLAGVLIGSCSIAVAYGLRAFFPRLAHYLVILPRKAFAGA